MEYININPECLFDTEEMIFGNKVLTEDIIDNLVVEYNHQELANIINDCFKKMKNIGFDIEAKEIGEFIITDNNKYTAGIKAIGQNVYKLVLNKKLLNKAKNKFLLTSIYHELCHLVQLDRLFKEKLIFWNYKDNKLQSVKADSSEVSKHLIINGGHTQYWLEAKNKINSRIKLEIPVEQKLTSDEARQLFLESFEADYVDTNFEDWFYGLEEDK